MSKSGYEHRNERPKEPRVAKWRVRWALGGVAASSLCLSAGLGCSAAGDEGVKTLPPPPGAVSSSFDGAGGGAAPPGVGGAPPMLALPSSRGGGAGTVAVEAPTRCDENGENCKCIAVANVGQVGRRETDAFDIWLNTKSNARVASIPDEITFDASSLEAYDVLILQNISTWTVTDDEVRAIQAWVEAGNGIMTLQGYSETADEVDVVNAVLEPFGVAYSKTPAGRGALWDDVMGWHQASPIALNMEGFAVAIHNGRPVTDLDGLGLPTLTRNDVVYGVTKDVAAGHVFAWADEWVTYSSQWTTEGLLRAEQFWYNSISYLTPEDACQVVIDDPNIIY